MLKPFLVKNHLFGVGNLTGPLSNSSSTTLEYVARLCTSCHCYILLSESQIYLHFFKLMFANNSKSLILQMAVINSLDSMGLYLINGEKLSINLVQFNGKDVTLTPNF